MSVAAPTTEPTKETGAPLPGGEGARPSDVWSGRERPILFSGAMVRALLAGTKTQTRRIVKRPARICAVCFEAAIPHNNGDGGYGVFGSDAYLRVDYCDHNEMTGERIGCPYGVPGDRLWVKETWAAHWMYNDVPPRECKSGLPGDNYWFAADGAAGVSQIGTPPAGLRGKTRVSIHMPRWASRLTLEVTEVRVERVQVVTDTDARAEGFSSEPVPGTLNGEPATVRFYNARDWYAHLWDAINGAGSWKANPWVWVVSFRRLA